jgi:hypothetical protein
MQVRVFMWECQLGVVGRRSTSQCCATPDATHPTLTTPRHAPTTHHAHQGADHLSPEDITFTVAGEVQPTAQQLEDLKFAWRCVKHVKSNAITVAKDGKLLGMGSGQPNRCVWLGVVWIVSWWRQSAGRECVCRQLVSVRPGAPRTHQLPHVANIPPTTTTITHTLHTHRVKSTEIALEKAAADVKGSVLASDAFFPFSWGDSVEMACKVGC